MTTTDNPIRTDELEGWLKEQASDPEKFRNAITDGSFKKKIAEYAAATNETQREILNQVREQTQATFLEMMKNNGTKVSGKGRLNLDPAGPATSYSPLHNKAAIGAPLDGVFNNVAEVFQAAWHIKGAHNESPEMQERIARAKNYMQEKIPSSGGFLVPEEFRSEILRLSLETAIVRPRARVVPMSSRTLTMPMVDSTSNVSSVYGGIVVYRTAEGADIPDSEAKFGQIELVASKQTAAAEVTNELVRDTNGAFTMFLNEVFPEAMSYYEDIDFLTGNGVGAPLGVLNANNRALLAVDKQSGQTGGTIQWENIIKMYARMLPSSINRAVWIASPDTFVELATMALNVGTGGSAVWLTDAHNRPQLTLLGAPVIMTEKAPSVVGTQGDLSFVDLGMYLIGDRQEMEIESSPHVKFLSNKTVFRVIQRNDGRPWLQSPITPRNNSATLSPFVQLATRA